MVETSRNRAVLASDARFIARVLRDAEKLDWGEGELDSKKNEIDSLMNKHARESWQEEAELYGLWKSNGISEKLGDDNLFQRHGWNEVDSGFRLWGAGAGKTALSDRRLGLDRTHSSTDSVVSEEIIFEHE